jgi:hypothetical protein
MDQPAAPSDRTGKRAPSANVTRQTKGVHRYGSQEVQLQSVEVLGAAGGPCEEFRYGEPIEIEVTYRSRVDTQDVNVSFLVRDETGVNLCGTMTWDEGVELAPLVAEEEGAVRFRFVNRLRPGRFGVSVAVTRINREDHRKPILYDQIDGVASFVSLADPERPVHYKFDAQIDVEVGKTGR